MDTKKALDDYNAGEHDPRIDALIEEAGKRAYRIAVRKFYVAFKDKDTDHEKLYTEELKRTGNEDILKG